MDDAIVPFELEGPQTLERLRPFELEWDDCVVHGHEGETELLGLWIRDADADLAGLELDPTDVEFVGRRRIPPEQLEDGVAGGREQRHGADKHEDRDECPN